MEQERQQLAIRLHHAAVRGDRPRVKKILFQNEDIIMDRETKRLCACMAITSADSFMLMRILDTGLDLTESLNRNGDSALHLAYRSLCPDLKTIRCLLQRSSKPQINNVNRNGETPLHIAASKSQVESAVVLLSSGANINAKTNDGDTALHIAIRSDHTRMICLLLVYKADINCENNRLELPIIMAANKKQLHILKLLLKQNYSSTKRIQLALTKCLADAVLKGDYDLVYLMLKTGAFVDGLVMDRLTVLHLAASRGDATLVGLLVAAGANVNAISDGVSALHCASQRGHNEIVKILLRNKAMVNQTIDDSSLGMTALHLAITGNHVQVVNNLLAFGANINAVDGSGNTPLHTAVSSLPDPGMEDSIDCLDLPQDMVKILLDNGADPNQKNHSGDLPHHIAVHRGHSRKLQHLLRGGCPMEVKDGYGETAFGTAMNNRRLDLMILFLAHGARTRPIIEEINPVLHISTHNLFIYRSVLMSGNLTKNDRAVFWAKFKANCDNLKNKGVPAISLTDDINLKSIIRSFIRKYLLRCVKTDSLFKAIDSLKLPSLIKKYLLLQDLIHESECLLNSSQ